MPYRPDIDGLRAIAVLAVVAFHYGVGNRVGGGYVGVDLFFVISGYLITGRLFADFSAGRHDIAGFYEKRIRRIFPALIVVLLFTLVGACWLRPLVDLPSTGQSVTAAALSFSNIFFFRTSGYFDEKLIGNPVLHTWSLAVEEQFYLLLPLLMPALCRLSRKQAMAVILALGSASLLASEWMLGQDRDAAFYLVPFRAWELLLGSLLAVAGPTGAGNRTARELLALAGLAGIAFSVVAYDSHTRFPGFAALLPCLGALALIHTGSGTGTWVSRMLSSPPLRFIGLISYSLYLVHWPLMIFAGSLTRIGAETPGIKLGLLATAIVLAALSWRFVERPFRRKVGPSARNPTLVAGGAAMLALAAVGGLLPAAWQMARPLSLQSERTLAYLADSPEHFMRSDPCFLTPASGTDAAFDSTGCLALAPDRPNVLILGDSHAAHLRAGLAAEFPHLHLLQATAVGCKPLVSGKGVSRCTALRDRVMDQWLPAHGLDTIVVSARWSASDAASFVATARHLKQYADRVVMIGPTPEYDRPLAGLLAREQQQGMPEGSLARGFLRPGPRRIDAMLAGLALPDGVTYVSPYRALCRSRCQVRTEEGAPLQFDYGHLTREGSAVLVHLLGSQLSAP